jgi:hypothetical protein
MKTLVFQSKIGGGSLTWDSKNISQLKTDHLIIESCLASVRSWCKKLGYEYKFVTHDLKWNFEFLSKNDPQLNCALQNWTHLPKEGYDQIIYLDNDIFVFEYSNSPPIVDFGLVCRYGDQTQYAKHYCGNDSLWWNSGVIVMSQKRCSHLSNWMLNYIPRARELSLFRDLPREESLITKYCAKYKPTKLDPIWNTMPPQTPIPMYLNTKFLHLLGTSKLNTLLKCPKEIQEVIMKNIDVSEKIIA